MRTHCSECGARLWSFDSQEKGLHPECEFDALEAMDSTSADLEDRLNDALDEGMK